MTEENALESLVRLCQSDDLLCPNRTDQEQFEKLVQFIDWLISCDFNRLASILYRVDVEEQKLKSALANNHSQKTAGHLIAELLLQRQAQKIKLRAAYRKYKSDRKD